MNKHTQNNQHPDLISLLLEDGLDMSLPSTARVIGDCGVNIRC